MKCPFCNKVMYAAPCLNHRGYFAMSCLCGFRGPRETSQEKALCKLIKYTKTKTQGKTMKIILAMNKNAEVIGALEAKNYEGGEYPHPRGWKELDDEPANHAKYTRRGWRFNFHYSTVPNRQRSANGEGESEVMA